MAGFESRIVECINLLMVMKNVYWTLVAIFVVAALGGCVNDPTEMENVPKRGLILADLLGQSCKVASVYARNHPYAGHNELIHGAFKYAHLLIELFKVHANPPNLPQ